MNFQIGDILKTFEKPIERAQSQKAKTTRNEPQIWMALKSAIPHHADHCDVVEYHGGILKLATPSGCVLFEVRQFYEQTIIATLRARGFKISRLIVNLAERQPETHNPTTKPIKDFIPY